MTDRSGPPTFWLVAIVLLVTAGGAFYVFRPRPEPQRVTVQYILISFQGARGTTATRSKPAAEKLAHETFTRARDGEDFDKLMKELSDDPTGGTYTMVNSGVTEQLNEFQRAAMVPAFGNLGFKLRVNAVGMTAYDPKDGPFGWFIMRRIK